MEHVDRVVHEYFMTARKQLFSTVRTGTDEELTEFFNHEDVENLTVKSEQKCLKECKEVVGRCLYEGVCFLFQTVHDNYSKFSKTVIRHTLFQCVGLNWNVGKSASSFVNKHFETLMLQKTSFKHINKTLRDLYYAVRRAKGTVEGIRQWAAQTMQSIEKEQKLLAIKTELKETIETKITEEDLQSAVNDWVESEQKFCVLNQGVKLKNFTILKDAKTIICKEACRIINDLLAMGIYAEDFYESLNDIDGKECFFDTTFLCTMISKFVGIECVPGQNYAYRCKKFLDDSHQSSAIQRTPISHIESRYQSHVEKLDKYNKRLAESEKEYEQLKADQSFLSILLKEKKAGETVVSETIV